MRLLHGALVIVGPVTDLEISVFREVSINTVLTPNPQLLVGVGSKDGS